MVLYIIDYHLSNDYYFLLFDTINQYPVTVSSFFFTFMKNLEKKKLYNFKKSFALCNLLNFKKKKNLIDQIQSKWGRYNQTGYQTILKNFHFFSPIILRSTELFQIGPSN